MFFWPAFPPQDSTKSAAKKGTKQIQRFFAPKMELLETMFPFRKAFACFSTNGISFCLLSSHKEFPLTNPARFYYMKGSLCGAIYGHPSFHCFCKTPQRQVKSLSERKTRWWNLHLTLKNKFEHKPSSYRFTLPGTTRLPPIIMVQYKKQGAWKMSGLHCLQKWL